MGILGVEEEVFREISTKIGRVPAPLLRQALFLIVFVASFLTDANSLV